jgi:nucleotide-binding universal stress UspA family protein
VVGVDCCLVSWIAVRWAAALAGWLDAEVIAAHALRPGLRRADVPAGSIGAQVAFTLERDWCAPLRAAAVPYRLVVREGSPVDVLAQVVEAEAPELAVTGRHIGAAERGRRSTSLGMLASPQVPTLVVPEPTPGTAMATPLRGRDVALRRILVGVDGSAPSLRALDWAVRLAGASGADVVAVSTIEDVPVFPLGPATAESSDGESDAPARAAGMLARACAPARAGGARVHTISRRGPPATVLVRMTTLLGADVVAAGIRGLDRPDHPTLGHVSRRLACRSARPVLLTP